MRTKLLTAIVLAAAVHSATAAEQDAETQLREALRGTMLQLRDAQAKTAEMEAAAVQSQLEAEKLKGEISGLQGQLVEERNAAANLRAGIEQAKERAALQEAKLAKWEQDYRKLVEETRKAQHALGKANGRIATLERVVAEQQVKNVELKGVADEILDRYTRHGLGATVLAKEPFISVNRAKIQTIMQDLETRIRAGGINTQ